MNKIKYLRRAGFFILMYMLAPMVMLAQQPAAKSADKTAEKDMMEQMLDNSRPNKHHAELGKLSGTWNFQDARLSFVKGTLTRKPLYEGRFYMVELTGGKLKLPIADGQMKEDNYRSLQLEGFDNPKMQYFTTVINNHIGSDIQIQTGSYDAEKKVFTYSWISELIKGVKIQNKRVLKIIDNEHYIEEYYEVEKGKDVKVRELDYTKISN